jgi:hypothetical protein
MGQNSWARIVATICALAEEPLDAVGVVPADPQHFQRDRPY